ncbi:metalloendopeptidase [Sorochytrium milnesiophthora]
MSPQQPPSVLALNVTPADIADTVERIRRVLDDAQTKIAAVPPEQRSLDNTLLAFHRAQSEAASLQVQCSFPLMVHADADVRSASASAKATLKSVFDASFANKAVYDAITSLSQDAVGKEYTRLYTATVALFERNGLHLPDAQRKVYAHLRQKITSLETLFEQNINEDTSTLLATRDELRGCSEAYISGLAADEQDRERLVVPLKTPDYLAIAHACKVPETRRRMYQAYTGRCPANRTVLAEILYFRHLAARCFYTGLELPEGTEPSHATFRLAANMARTPSKVHAFLTTLANRLEDKWKNDVAILKELQAKDDDARATETLSAWDIEYYVKQLQREKYSIDDELVRQYFPARHVLDAILKTYEGMFNLRFTPLPDTPNKWHADVLCFAVHDMATKDKDPQLLGHFYLDLYPRSGKYGHQCVAPLMPACTFIDANNSSVKTLPIACNVGNLSKPTNVTIDGKEQQLSLLRFTEARTFFHEFGHVVHCLCTQSETSLFSWSWALNPYPGGVEIDFLELPSQMLENWLYDADTLNRLSSHYETGKPLPIEMQRGLSAVRGLNAGYAYRRQCFMSLYDQEVHSAAFMREHGNLADDQVDRVLQRATAAVSSDEQLDLILAPSQETLSALAAGMAQSWWAGAKKWIGMQPVDGSWSYASWYHLASYDASYYSYLWSEVFSHDCFSLFKQSPRGCGDSELGMRYRRAVLDPGANRGGMDMVTDFLGRAPNDAAFLKHVLG